MSKKHKKEMTWQDEHAKICDTIGSSTDIEILSTSCDVDVEIITETPNEEQNR